MTRILRVLAPNPGPLTLDGTNTWVVGEQPSVVIDPGPDDPSHLLGVLDEATPVGAVLLTHRHADHAEGARRFARAAGVEVYAFRPEGPERALADGDIVRAGAVRVRVVHTPGHTQDHLAFFLDGPRALFTGDAVLGRGTSVVDPPEGDMAQYLESLGRMRDLDPLTIYPGHGPVVFDAADRLEAYLAHRREREEQVWAALADGRKAPAQVVPGIYEGEVDPSMFPLAERSVLAHLLKLEREGRVARSGRGQDVRFERIEPRACECCGRPAAKGSRYCSRCAVSALQERP